MSTAPGRPHPSLRFRDISLLRQNRLAAQPPSRLHLTYSARGAFYQLLRSLPPEKGKRVVLPAFHCTALVEPAVQAGFDVVFYRVRPDFSPDFADIRAKMASGAALLVAVHYFGFPTAMRDFLQTGREHGAYVVEDCAHSFLTSHASGRVGQEGDFALFSYYKFAPSIAGGGLGINVRDFALPTPATRLPRREQTILTKRLVEQMLQNSPERLLSRALLTLEQKRVAAKHLAAGADGAPSQSQFMDDPYLFSGDLARTEMPWLCRRVIECCNWDKMANVRRRNYRLLSSLLRKSALFRHVFPVLPDTVCPWAFPVLLEERIAHEHKLRSLGVPLYTFGEILHPRLALFDDSARKDAEYLSQQLLLLPVHAGLSEEDVTRFAETVNRYVEELDSSKATRSGPNEALAPINKVLRGSEA